MTTAKTRTTKSTKAKASEPAEVEATVVPPQPEPADPMVEAETMDEGHFIRLQVEDEEFHALRGTYAEQWMVYYVVRDGQAMTLMPIGRARTATQVKNIAVTNHLARKTKGK